MIGAGTKFKLSMDGGTTFIPVAKIKELGMPDESRDSSEDSYLDEQDIVKEFVAGMIDGGEMSITLKWNATDTEQIELHTRFKAINQVAEPYQIEFTDGTLFTVPAIITGRSRAIPKNETITQSFTFKVSGSSIEV